VTTDEDTHTNEANSPIESNYQEESFEAPQEWIPGGVHLSGSAQLED